MFFYYYPKGILKKNAINVYEIPVKFNIDEKEYMKLVNQLYETIKLLRKEFENVNEIYVPYWKSYLKRLSVAYAKEAEGRIRSKYTINSGTYQLDGNTLLSESQSELSQIRSELDSNVNKSHTIS